MRRERHERAVLAVSVRYEEPLQYMEAAMAAFDAALISDPTDTEEARSEALIRELLEQEVA